MKYLILVAIIQFLLLTPARANAPVDLTEFSKLTTLHEGRVKPVDTFARIILREIYGRESFEKINSNEWLAEAIFNPKAAYQRKIFKINNPSAITTLGLPADSKYFNFIELYQAFSNNQETIQSLLQVSDDGLDPNNKYLKDLYHRFTLFMGISRSFSFLFKDFSVSEKDRYSYFDLKKIDNPNVPLPIQNFFSTVEEDASFKSIYFFQDQDENLWLTPWEKIQQGKKSFSEIEKWNQIYLAYLANNSAQLNLVASQLNPSRDMFKIKLEIVQNQVHFSTWIIALYTISFLLFSFSAITKKTFLLEYSSLTLYTGALIHLVMILSRSIILSRPPVTNLYESILFVSFTSVVVGIIYYLKTKNNIGLFLSSTLGVVLLYLGQGYERSGDNLGMIVAVLDTNFWLATHVLTISVGYGCALVTSFMAHYYLLKYPQQSKLENDKLHANMHLSLLFSLFFTILGTILGGIWADQSWGRFWGWDPKENGALLICLWLLWIAHAKISRHFEQASYAFFSGLTSVIVILAWFGVNLLNVGLHSYGFSNDTALSITLFTLAEFITLLFLYLRAKRTIA